MASPLLDDGYKAWREGRMEDAVAALQSGVTAGEAAAIAPLFDAALEAGLTGDAAASVRATLDSALGGPLAPVLDEAAGQRAAARLGAVVLASGLGRASDWPGAIATRQSDHEHGDLRAGLEIALLCELAGFTGTALSLLEALARSGQGEAIAALLRLGAQRGEVSEAAVPHAPALARAHPLGPALQQAISGLPAAAASAPCPVPDAQVLADALFACEPERERLHDAPRIETAPGLISAVLSDYLTAASVPFLHTATIFDPDTGEQRPDEYRRSLTASLPPSAMDLPALAIRDRMLTLAGAQSHQSEPLAVLVYQPGQEYRPHFDFIAPDGGRASDDLARRGQRAHTVLVKLNEEHTGGATSFPRLDVAWQGRRGDALVFDNLDAAGKGEKASLHAGLPVETGTKILASLWVRER